MMKRLHDYSQYFLRNPRFVKELIGHTNIKKPDSVVDIGAGSGIITASLATKCRHVYAYELEPSTVKTLRKNTEQFTNVTIIEEDFLSASLPDTPYKVCANIPFHLSSPIIKKLTESAHRPLSIYLIVQKQFAHKLLINDSRFTGLLGAQVAPIYTTKIKMRLKRTDFMPHPAVDTVLIELKQRSEFLIPEDRLSKYRKFVADCFHSPELFARAKGSDNPHNEPLKPSQLTADEWQRLFMKQR